MYASAALPLIGASDAGASDCADGYRTSDVILKAVEENDDLRDNLSAAAHLIHGSPEDRFTVTYCPGHISREEIEGVGFNYGDLAEMSSKYDISKNVDGDTLKLTATRKSQFAGNPVAGDVKYGDQGYNQKLQLQGLRRLFLHASQLRFEHPLSGDWLEVEAPFPVALERVLKAL